MSFAALLVEGRQDQEDRRVYRRELRLEAFSRFDSGPEERVTVHNISLTGLLIQSSVRSLSIDDTLRIALSGSQSVEAKVVWVSDGYFGCEFAQPVSPGAVSAALLRSDPRPTPWSAPLFTNATNESCLQIDTVPNFGVPLVLGLGVWALIGCAVLFLGRLNGT